MGIASCLEPRFRAANPNTPPEVLTPDSASYCSRQFEERSWNPPAPPSPPMSHYDPAVKANDMSSSNKGLEEGQARRDMGSDQTAPRQQLPSLSSIFGPPTHIRSFHSPLSDRPSSYSATSPLDRPPSSVPSLDRPFSSSSYFPPSTTSTASQPRSVLDPRYQDRPQIPALSRVFPGPLSPHSRDEQQQRPDSRPEYASSGGQWSAHHEASREYSLGSRGEAPYRPTAERYPAHLSGTSRDEGRHSEYREQLTPQTPSHNLPATPTSSTASEGAPAKDGLGPKIWTGTHFLPRFVRAAEVPGEGMCYFYDDGSHCKTVIDGEQVNAHWGVTKAGKPRKRLAIACVTCREKKIKCDPDYPRCVQCEKFGRVCKFKNAPRGGHNASSPSTPPAETEDTRRLGGLIRPPADYTRPGSHSSGSVSPRTTLRHPSPDMPTSAPAKRIRIGYDHYSPTTSVRSPMAPIPDAARQALPWRQPETLPRIHEDILCRAWQTDPYVSDPESVTSTIASVFVHMETAALRFLPPKPSFYTWIQNSAHRKSPEDLMLVYSILAIGAILSQAGSRSVAHEYAQVARYAAEHTQPSLQLVQARLALSMYHLAVSRQTDANHMMSGAISAAMCLQLNVELDDSEERALAAFPWGLTREEHAECRRRTFWSCFLMERLNGAFPTRPATINKDDIFLRLPAADITNVHERAPDFNPILSPLSESTGAGIMSYLIQITAMWGDVMTFINRASRRGELYDNGFDAFYRRTIAVLDAWESSLPTSLRLLPVGLETISPEDQGPLILLHTVHHLARVKLHRHVYPRALRHTTAHEFVHMSMEHGAKLLQVAVAVAQAQVITPPPFISTGILEAIDVLSSSGYASALPGLVDRFAVARSVLEVLGTTWEDAKAHCMAMDHRLERLIGLRGWMGNLGRVGREGVEIQGTRVFESETQEGVVLRWQMPDGMDKRFPKEMDCVYPRS
ncbi:fungal-specific transcription factor domain-containing protein [Triangularia setosa]|uniref:Fungal-specific transcription factor domain-containing protein n=1 Tax=Triangularia setosa TaxID=2587417 RepID=A0AAN6VZX0_9PEZI|nr:fungal-specific transcription factor domain-containing protein [Podospora setosa]